MRGFENEHFNYKCLSIGYISKSVENDGLLM